MQIVSAALSRLPLVGTEPLSLRVDIAIRLAAIVVKG